MFGFEAKYQYLLDTYPFTACIPDQRVS